MTAPRVTVLMPAFDAARHLREAVDSVLGQTYGEFELLAIDDGSTDDTADILGGYVARDRRVRLVRNGRNLGLIATLNRGLDLARGELVARFDADDVCLPQRLARQVAWMDAHPRVDVGAPWVAMFNEGGEGVGRRAETHDEIVAQGLFFCPLLHPSVVMRRQRLHDLGLRYPAEFVHIEDYALWVQAARTLRFGGQPEVLVRMRFHPDSVSSVHQEVQLAAQLRVQRLALANLGLEPTEEEMALHRLVSQRDAVDPSAYDRRTLEAIGRWLQRVLDAGVASHAVEPGVLADELARQFMEVCKIAAPRDAQAALTYVRRARAWRANTPRRALAGLAGKAVLPGAAVRLIGRWRGAGDAGLYRSPR